MHITNVNYRAAQFIMSAPSLVKCPDDIGHEVAFAGRSNAGKSSAINTLTGIKGLARTSKTPGRTQLLNFFNIGEDQRLVDLPGYGYAKVPHNVKQQWGEHVTEYLRRRLSLAGLVLVMDIRHPLQPFDMQMLEWSAQAGVPTHALLTKADKLSRGAAHAALLTIDRRLTELDPEGTLFTLQCFSATKKTGLVELKEILDHWFTSEFSVPNANK